MCIFLRLTLFMVFFILLDFPVACNIFNRSEIGYTWALRYPGGGGGVSKLVNPHFMFKL